ncbi:MAG: hypothetical protein ACP5QT_00655 [Brevinematia bacterium]
MNFIKKLIFFMLITASLFSSSLWKDGNIFYKPKIKDGELIKIKFSEKTIMKYRIEQKNSSYLTKKGIRGGGEVFSFFPDAEAKENDTVKNSQSFTINNENNFNLKAKVSSIQENVASFTGTNSIIIAGENYNLKISGEFDIYDLGADNSILSTDINNLAFQIDRANLKTEEIISENDIIFQTNYTEISTNIVINPTNNTTNTEIVTNLSSFEIKLKGISEEKKRQLIFNYLNSIINQLFK